MEKTCCLTSEEGFEFSAPMLLRSAVRDASAMMPLPEEVGAHALAERCDALRPMGQRSARNVGFTRKLRHV